MAESICADDDKCQSIKMWKLNCVKRPFSLFKGRSHHFHHHVCSPNCIESTEGHLLSQYANLFRPLADSVHIRHASPYFVPINFEYQRIDSQGPCHYVTPCGLKLYTYEQILAYLRVTESKLGVEQFVLKPNVYPYRPHACFKVFFYKPDISNGLEPVPVQAINELDAQPPPSFQYVTKYIKDGKDTKKEEETNDFLVCCDCEDGDCQDASKCSCQQLTKQETEIIDLDDTAGYEYKRLLNPPLTAVFECNQNCKCNQRCLNRVVQNGLKMRLQLFKSKNRGWAVRTLHDIPKGAFVCTYVGEILKPEVHHERLKGSKYAVDLNYIDLCEQAKISIQKDKDKDEEELQKTKQAISAIQPEHQLMERGDDKRLDDEDLPDFLETDSLDSSSSDILTHVSSLSDWDSSSLSSYDEDEECQGDQTLSSSDSTETSSSKTLTTSADDGDESRIDDQSNQNRFRSFFQERLPYVCDASQFGNVSRFFNYSCSPNLVVQNVFTHTHDPRFSTIAFFAAKHILAFSELTWDYGLWKEIDKLGFLCKCHSINCCRNDKQK